MSFSAVRNNKGDLTKSISLAVIISYATMAVSFLSTIFFTPFMLNKVGDDYGVYSFAQSIVNWLTLFATGFSASFIRYASKEFVERKDISKTNAIFVVLMFVTAGLVFVVGTATWIFFATGLATIDSFTESQNSLFDIVFLLSVIQCTITILISPFTLPITFKRKFVLIRLANLISGILYPSISFVVLLFAPKMIWVVLIMFLAQDITQIALVIYSLKRLGFSYAKLTKKEIRSGIRSVIVFSAFILINSAVDTFNSSVDKILLGAIKGASFVTIYQLGMSFKTYMTSLSCVVSGNYIPLINQYGIEGNIDAVNSLFKKVGTFQAIIIFLIIGGFLSCGLDFIDWWVGPEMSDVFIVAISLMIDASFPLCENISIEYQRCMNKHKFRAFLYAGLTIANFVISLTLLLLVPSLNPVVSCLIGTLTTEFISTWLVINIYNIKVLKMDVFGLLKNFLFLAAICLIAWGGTYAISLTFNSLIDSSLLRLIAKGTIFVCLYGLILICLTIIFGIFKKSVITDNLPSKVSRVLLFWKKV